MEQDGVIIEGLTESLGTKIGNDARLLDIMKTRQEIYFKMCGMNGIIDLSDMMPGSQLHNLPKVSQEKVLENLTGTFIIKNTMENKDFISIIEKAAEPGADVYQQLQNIDELKCSQDMYGSKSLHSLILYNIFCPLPIDKFSEADYIINIWAPLLKYTFCKTSLWPHWGDTVPAHLFTSNLISVCWEECIINMIGLQETLGVVFEDSSYTLK